MKTEELLELEHAAALLDAHPGYRVTRALPPLSTLPLPQPAPSRSR